MPNLEIELNPVDFITIGTVGPKGQRVFYLQAGKGDEVVTLTVEKEQAWALGEALRELMDDLENRFPDASAALVDIGRFNMELRDPIAPRFRVAQMGLGYDEDRNLIVLVAQELVVPDAEGDELIGGDASEPGIVRLWSNRAQMRALSAQAQSVVQSGRPDPRQNGRLVFYWT